MGRDPSLPGLVVDNVIERGILAVAFVSTVLLNCCSWYSKTMVAESRTPPALWYGDARPAVGRGQTGKLLARWRTSTRLAAVGVILRCALLGLVFVGLQDSCEW